MYGSSYMVLASSWLFAHRCMESIWAWPFCQSPSKWTLAHPEAVEYVFEYSTKGNCTRLIIIEIATLDICVTLTDIHINPRVICTTLMIKESVPLGICTIGLECTLLHTECNKDNHIRLLYHNECNIHKHIRHKTLVPHWLPYTLPQQRSVERGHMNYRPKISWFVIKLADLRQVAQSHECTHYNPLVLWWRPYFSYPIRLHSFDGAASEAAGWQLSMYETDSQQELPRVEISPLPTQIPLPEDKSNLDNSKNPRDWIK